jgi:hypothetical protein
MGQLGNADFQYAVGAAGNDLRQICGIRQTEAAVEAAAGPLNATVAGAGFAGFARTIAAHGQNAVFGDNFNILGINAWNIGAQNIAILFLLDITGGIQSQVATLD